MVFLIQANSIGTNFLLLTMDTAETCINTSLFSSPWIRITVHHSEATVKTKSSGKVEERWNQLHSHIYSWRTMQHTPYRTVCSRNNKRKVKKEPHTDTLLQVVVTFDCLLLQDDVTVGIFGLANEWFVSLDWISNT